MDWLELLIRVLIVLFFGTVTTVQQPGMGGDGRPPGNTFRSYTIIENVDMVVMESFPVQVRLNVSGQQPDGCDFPVITEVARGDDTVTISIYREVPIDVMCPMVLLPYADTISLGEFQPGSYTFIINDYVIEQDF